MKRLLTFILITHSLAALQGATVSSVTGSGDWSSTASWSGGVVPGTNDDVVINGNITVSSNVSCLSLLINSSKQLSIGSGITLSLSNGSFTNNGTCSFSGSNNKLLINNNNWATCFTNNGTFSAGSGSVELSTQYGSGLSMANNTTTFNNIVLSNVQQMNFGSNITVNGALRINSGSYISTHPSYGSNATLEINRSIYVNGNYNLWASGNGSNVAPNIAIISGTVVVDYIECYLKKSLTVASGASLDVSKVCFTFPSTFTGIANNGSLLLGGVTVVSGTTWNVNGNYILSTLRIERGGTVNANSYTLTMNAARNGCNGTNGIMEVLSGGTFNPGTGTVIFNPPYWLDITGSSVNGGVTFNSMVINGPGTVNVPATNTVTVNGNITINNGGTVNQPNNITYGSGATATNNGTSQNGSIPATVPVSTTTTLPGSSGGGNYAVPVSIASPTIYNLSSNLQISGIGRKIFIVSPGAELVPGNYSIDCDTVYVYGKLTVSNAAGISAMLAGSTKLVLGSASQLAYTAASGTQTIMPRSDYSNMVLAGNSLKSFGAGTCGVQGDFYVNEGTVQFDASSLVDFNGTSQTIQCPSFYSVGFSGTGTKTLTTQTRVKGQVSLSGDVVLASNGNLVLHSDAVGTASIGTISSPASISGNIIVERYIPASRKWRFLGLPVSGASFQASWQQQVHITGAGTGGGIGSTNSNGFDYTASNQPGVYWYNENVNSIPDYRWQSIANTSVNIMPGKGYRIFIRGDRLLQGDTLINGSTYTPTPVTLRASGTLVSGQIDQTLSCSNGCGSNDGWNLVANPYPSSLDWDNAAWISARTGQVSNTIYIYNPVSNTFAAWNPSGGGVNGGTHYIASGQAFFVKTMTNNALLSFKESYKVFNPGTGLFGKSAGLINNLKIQLLDTAVLDETVVFFLPESSKGIDPNDGEKMSASQGIATLAAGSSKRLVFNATTAPEANGTDSIQLYSQLYSGKAYTFNFTGVASFNSRVRIKLLDRFAQTITILNDASPRYSFTTGIDARSYAGDRFVLLIQDAAAASLPVELIRFQAKTQGAGALLEWQTSQEINSDYFAVERSTDGSAFMQIGKVKASGNSINLVDYSFPDELLPASDNIYYRLRQADRDGAISYSPVAFLGNHHSSESGGIPKAVITMFPIPTKDILNIHFQDINFFLPIQVLVTDPEGHTTIDIEFPPNIIKQGASLPVGGLHSGIYFIQVKQAGKILLKKALSKE